MYIDIRKATEARNPFEPLGLDRGLDDTHYAVWPWSVEGPSKGLDILRKEGWLVRPVRADGRTFEAWVKKNPLIHSST